MIQIFRYFTGIKMQCTLLNRIEFNHKIEIFHLLQIILIAKQNYMSTIWELFDIFNKTKQIHFIKQMTTIDDNEKFSSIFEFLNRTNSVRNKITHRSDRHSLILTDINPYN